MNFRTNNGDTNNPSNTFFENEIKTHLLQIFPHGLLGDHVGENKIDFESQRPLNIKM